MLWGLSRPFRWNCVVGIGVQGIPEIMTHRKFESQCFWNFSSSFGDPSKSWTPNVERVPWHPDKGGGRPGNCLARFGGHRPSPDLLAFPVFCSLWSPCRPHYHPSSSQVLFMPSLLLIIHRQSPNPFCPVLTLVGPHPSSATTPIPMACPL